MHRLRPRLSLALTILLEAGALWALLDMGAAPWAAVTWRTPDLWLVTADPADLVAGTLRMVAVFGALWLLVATVLQVILAAMSVARPDRWRVPGLPAGLRRRIDGAVAALVATSTLAAPAVAVASPGLPRHVPVPIQEQATETAPPTEGRHTVVPGDHLWSIAEGVVQRAQGEATDAAVTAYWRELIAANADLPSGDPDLIRPGEQVRLPPL